MLFIEFSEENMLLNDWVDIYLLLCEDCHRSEANSADLIDFFVQMPPA